MAFINDIYLFVETERAKRPIQASEHPVEEGISLTDHIRRSPLSISLTGEIVGNGYEDDIAALEQMQKNGKLVEYAGCNLISDVVILSFETEHIGEIRKGCRFTMELSEIRIADTPFVDGSGNDAVQQIEEGSVPAAEVPPVRTHTVKSGDTLWGLAKSYYGNGSQFPKIFDENRDKISNPDRINIGQVLVIP